MDNFRKPVGIAINELSDITVVCDDGSVWEKDANESLFIEKRPIPGTKRHAESKGRLFCSVTKDNCEYFVYKHGPYQQNLCSFGCTLEPIEGLSCPLIKIKEDTKNAVKED